MVGLAGLCRTTSGEIFRIEVNNHVFPRKSSMLTDRPLLSTSRKFGAGPAGLETRTRISRISGPEVIRISNDNQQSHDAFVKQHGPPLIILTDTDGVVIKAYGVKKNLGLFSRPRQFCNRQDGNRRTDIFIAGESDRTRGRSRGQS